MSGKAVSVFLFAPCACGSYWLGDNPTRKYAAGAKREAPVRLNRTTMPRGIYGFEVRTHNQMQSNKLENGTNHSSKTTLYMISLALSIPKLLQIEHYALFFCNWHNAKA